MIYSTCRLRPILVIPDLEKKYLIKARYQQSEINYKVYKEKLSQNSIIVNPFSLKELQKEYPHIDFTLPTIVEFCSGTGEFLIDLADRYPEFLFIGIEIALPCIQRALINIKKSGNLNRHNLLFYYGEGRDFLSYDFSYFVFSLIMVNFPDPWPKKKHIKRRIISNEFVSLSKDRLIPGGSFHTTTDVENLYHYHKEIINQTLTPLIPLTITDNSINNIGLVKDFYLSSSRYQEKNLSQSQKVFYTHHRKT